MGRKLLLDILRIAAQNNGFSNMKTVNKDIVAFTNGWMMTKTGNIYNLKNYNDRNAPVNIDIDTSNPITVDLIKIIKEFLSTEFCLDGEKK